MSDISDLMSKLMHLRQLLEGRIKLSRWRLEVVRREAQRVGDQCWYCLGVASSRAHAPNDGATVSAAEKIDRLLNVIRGRTAQKGPGNPRRQPSALEELIAYPEIDFRRARGEDCLPVIRDLCVRGLLDPKTRDTTHLARYQRAKQYRT
ncbi:hypothetical protein ABIF76_000068 [Bradyrhizobium ottawaense]|uniref:Uncharacterized protein n=1 Tax=Bradyrhizobium ottawaense TaxID=931866 RepID=A0ABV4G4G6_9BRAD